MQVLFNPLFHLALGATGLESTGILLKDVLAIRKQFRIDTGKSNPKKVAQV
ncbi:hypothetical protein [Adhaeribacter radiodurans]|uniref:Uncharacterized protein n=1 Tax=Adhaeribacter radiodurans TaxID=2745197 RepID=A0A7L7LDH5_9BACT|nr:hypothetical protein [Adhaeribacter radiodurans]QMU30449.1 hypothetical protein HUW48_21565 [Adhaeribacter radiodurans]